MSLRRTSTGPGAAAGTSPSLASASPLSIDSPPNQSTALQLSRIERQGSIPSRMTLFPDLNQIEIRFLDAMLHKGIKIDKYIIGPSFRDRHLQAFVDHLNAEMPHVKDAFIACASHLAVNESLQQLAHDQSVGYRRAAAAIASLRTSSIYSDDDLSMMLIVGVAIVTFTLHHSNCLPVCKHILGIVHSMYEKDPALLERLNSDSAAFLLCLQGTEIEGCAISCQQPTVRIREGTFDHLVDRFIGVSAPIFTHLYDICQLSQQFKQMRSEAHDFDDSALEERRCSLQTKLQEWRPTTAAIHVAEGFTRHEAITMIAQAKTLQLAGLIILLRLRYAYGSDNQIPLTMANDILGELDGTMELTGHAVPFADLPHLVACFELKDHLARHDALKKSRRHIDFSQYCLAEQQASLVAFWRARDEAGTRDIFWTDVASCIT